MNCESSRVFIHSTEELCLSSSIFSLTSVSGFDLVLLSLISSFLFDFIDIYCLVDDGLILFHVNISGFSAEEILKFCLVVERLRKLMSQTKPNQFYFSLVRSTYVSPFNSVQSFINRVI